MSQFTMNKPQEAPERPFSDRYQEGYPTKLGMPGDAISMTGEQLVTISDNILDIRDVTESLFGKLSPILVQTPRETTAVEEKQASAPTKLGQSLDEIINQLRSALDYLRDLNETIRL